MYGRHVKSQLSAYCNGELDAETARHVSEHLLTCAKCRSEHERISIGVRFGNRLRTEGLNDIRTPESIWSGIEHSLDRALARASFRGRAIDARFRWTSGRVLAIAASLVLVIGVAVTILLFRSSRSGWAVDRLAGTPRIDSEQISGEAKLKVGQWIETDRNSRARLRPGDIGEVEVEPDSRARLLKSAKDEYRLDLERGEVKAKISAPPRLFFVNTPSATAIDLGCAYTLHVDRSGSGKIAVTAGLVELVANGRKSTIPAEAECLTRPGTGPGTPYFEDASEEFKAALATLDFGGSEQRSELLPTILHDARKRDSLTLWHLLARVEGNDRELVYERLAELVPPPPGVTLAGIMQLDPDMLESWFMQTEPAWFE
jgi:hypothetical protein